MIERCNGYAWPAHVFILFFISRKKQKIDFFDLNNLNRIVLSYSVAPHKPTILCAMFSTTLLYVDDSKDPREIQFLDCNTSRPRPAIGNIFHGYLFHLVVKRCYFPFRSQMLLFYHNT